MLTAKVEDLSVVRLMDGRKGTVVMVYDMPGKPLAYEVESSAENGNLWTVPHDQVESVLWAPSFNRPGIGAL